MNSLTPKTREKSLNNKVSNLKRAKVPSSLKGSLNTKTHTHSLRGIAQSMCSQGSAKLQGKFENLPEHSRDVIVAILTYPEP